MAADTAYDRPRCRKPCRRASSSRPRSANRRREARLRHRRRCPACGLRAPGCRTGTSPGGDLRTPGEAPPRSCARHCRPPHPWVAEGFHRQWSSRHLPGGGAVLVVLERDAHGRELVADAVRLGPVLRGASYLARLDAILDPPYVDAGVFGFRFAKCAYEILARCSTRVMALHGMGDRSIKAQQLQRSIQFGLSVCRPLTRVRGKALPLKPV